MAVNLTIGAISKILTAKCTCALKDLKPVLQVTDIHYYPHDQTFTEDDNQWHEVLLSDGSFLKYGLIAEEIFISNKLQTGSIVQLTKFRLIELLTEGECEISSGILVTDVHVIVTICDIIGDPKPYHHNKTSLIEKSTPLVNTGHSYQEDDHAAKDIPRIASMMEKNKEDDMCACFKKLENIGWGTEDPLYDTALLLFGESAEYRKLWLLLKPESCGKWVKNAGSRFGLLG